jgi:hypothetical protein
MTEFSVTIPGSPGAVNRAYKSLALFWSKVDKTPTCWLWTAYIERNGYAYFKYKGERIGVHRLSYELVNGPIPAGLQIDHLCRVRHCLRPDHLEAVTTRENLMRGIGVAARNAQKTHCDRGHAFTPENTPPNGRDGRGRGCRECRRITARLRWRRDHPL